MPCWLCYCFASYPVIILRSLQCEEFRVTFHDVMNGYLVRSELPSNIYDLLFNLVMTRKSCQLATQRRGLIQNQENKANASCRSQIGFLSFGFGSVSLTSKKSNSAVSTAKPITAGARESAVSYTLTPDECGS